MDHVNELLLGYFEGLELRARDQLLTEVLWLLDAPFSILDETDLLARLKQHLEAPTRSERFVPMRRARIGRQIALVAIIDHAVGRVVASGAALREEELYLLSRDDDQSQTMARQAEFQRHQQARDICDPLARWRALRRGPLSPETLAAFE